MALKAGIIGAGGISRCHLQGYRALGDRVEVVSCCDIEPGKAQKYAEEYAEQTEAAVCQIDILPESGQTASGKGVRTYFRYVASEWERRERYAPAEGFVADRNNGGAGNPVQCQAVFKAGRGYCRHRLRQ